MPGTTSKSINPPLKVNGGFADLSQKYNLNDPEFRREIMRPSDIKEDVKLMSNRKRVSLILKSESFRRDLEDIVKLQLHSGPYPDNWTTIQSLSDYITPQTQYGVATSTFNKGLVMPTLPINDFNTRSLSEQNSVGTSPRSKYSKMERIYRCKLASVLRLIDIFGWTSGMTSTATVRLGSQSDHFAINPFGLLFHEITATSLVKIDLAGNIVDSGTSGLQIDQNAWLVPSAIYVSLPKIRCVIQLKNSATIAISAMKCSLLPLSQEAISLGKVAVHDGSSLQASSADQEGVASDQQANFGIASALEDSTRVLLVRSHGLYAMGTSVEEAWHFAFNAMAACQSQLKLLLLGSEKLSSNQITGEAATADLLSTVRLHIVGEDSSTAHDSSNGATYDAAAVQSEFEALMQQLDSAGYRTGYIYHSVGEDMDSKDADLLSLDSVGEENKQQPLFEKGVQSEVALPPTASSFSKPGDDKTATLPPAAGLAVNTWATTPNAYKREQISEIGTTNPKLITRWLPEPLPNTSGLAEAVSTSNQFAPQGEDSKELSQQQRAVKQLYFEDSVQAGPSSRLVEGSGTLDEARTLQLAREGKLPGDRMVVVGAVSRAIIQRDVQHNVAAYRSVYATNPFHQVGDEELAQYRREVARNTATPEERARMDEEERRERLEEEQRLQAEQAKIEKQQVVEEVVAASRTAVAQQAAAPPSKSLLTSEQHKPTATKTEATHLASAAGPSERRTDTSELEITTHTEVTDAEAKDTSKEKKKKRRFKNPFRKNKHKE